MSWTRQTFAVLCSTGIVVSSFLVIFAALADGTVYVTFVKKLLAPDGVANDRFGYVHSVDGDRLAVSALGDDDAGADAGSVTVFKRNSGGVNNWGAVARLVPSDGTVNDFFGRFLASNSEIALIGAFGEDSAASG